MRCNPLAAGQSYFWMESDGVFWRPWCGAQVLYSLAAPITFSDVAGLQLGLSVPVPPKLLPDGRARLRVVAGFDHLGGVTQSPAIQIKIGPLQEDNEPNLISIALVTANISLGMVQQFYRTAPTVMRKQGSGSVGNAASMSGSGSVVRPAGWDVGDMDTVTNYLTVWQSLATGNIGEYGVLHTFILELIG
jgi:hypothetical protein